MSFVKVIVNSISAFYGSMVVGSLGISNNVAGIPTSIANGFQDGQAAIISQSLGNQNLDRALDTFKKTLIITLVIWSPWDVFHNIFYEFYSKYI